jgi:hypothetical protein
MASLGSYTGWYAGFKLDVISEIKKRKEEREKEKEKEKKGENVLHHITGDA